MRDVLFGISGYPAVLVAHDLKLYRLLAERPRTLPEVCDALNIAPRAAEALLSVSAAVGRLEERDGRYSLTPVAENYLLEGSATYYGGYFDMMIQNYAMYSFESLRRAVLTGAPQFYGGDDVFTSHRSRAADRCRLLTRKSFEGLEPGGRVILHEMLYEDRKTGPFSTAAMKINMPLQHEAGRQYSGRELCEMLEEAGSPISK